MLEIMDEYLSDFYKMKFWGYSLPLYLSATHGCHPNYAIYLAEKNTLSEKAFDELLKGISEEDKFVFSKEKAEKYYKRYMESYYEDASSIEMLTKEFNGKKVLLLAPGKTLSEFQDAIKEYLLEKPIVVCVNFYDAAFSPSYIFTGNIRRFNKVISEHQCKIIATSNIPECTQADFPINFSSFTGSNNEVFDNSGLMALRLLETLGVKEVNIAGMDGFTELEKGNYYGIGFEAYHTNKMSSNNGMVSSALKEISKHLQMHFITPTNYTL